MQTTDRGFAAAHPVGYLTGREAHQVPQHQHVALVFGKRLECELQTPAAFRTGLVAVAGEFG
jgi:hypothetical protein